MLFATLLYNEHMAWLSEPGSFSSLVEVILAWIIYKSSTRHGRAWCIWNSVEMISRACGVSVSSTDVHLLRLHNCGKNIVKSGKDRSNIAVFALTQWTSPDRRHSWTFKHIPGLLHAFYPVYERHRNTFVKYSIGTMIWAIMTAKRKWSYELGQTQVLVE